MPSDIIHTPPTLELPNFDCMSANELRAFWKKWHTATRAKAIALVGVRKDAPKLAHTLANYAINKCVAVEARTQGLIATAQRYEGYCDALYKDLPEDLRW